MTWSIILQVRLLGESDFKIFKIKMGLEAEVSKPIFYVLKFTVSSCLEGEC